MLCSPVTFRTFDASFLGLKTIGSNGDGYSFDLEWYRTYVKPSTYQLFYNIYYSTIEKDIFSDGIKYVSDSPTLKVTIGGGFKIGVVYYFCVRATAFEPSTFNYSELPYVSSNLRIYPETALDQNITSTSTIIPILDASLFPPIGLIQIGSEIIGYSSVDKVDNLLILSNIGQRGLYNTIPREHTTDGYDGYVYAENPFVRVFSGFENMHTVIGIGENRFSEQYARTNVDGYKEQKDIITSSKNLQIVDNINEGFPSYDYAGWHRTSIPDLLSGKCLGSYFGGEQGCADGYDSTGGLRGIPIQTQMMQREEMLLESTGSSCILFKRMYEGKTSRHYDNISQNSAHRGIDNHGTIFVGGYEQYFNSKRSDGRLFIRFGPTKENYERQEPGIENVFVTNCWISVTPTIKDGDFIIRYNKDGSEEWRYEIVDVERSDTFILNSGLQKFTAIRVRKTDPIYQVRSIADTSMFPREIMTSINSVNGIPAHSHRIVVNENILNVIQINQTTSIIQGHNHDIVSGMIQNVLGHTHSIIL